MTGKETKVQWGMISQVTEMEKRSQHLDLFDWKAQGLDIHLFLNY